MSGHRRHYGGLKTEFALPQAEAATQPSRPVQPEKHPAREDDIEADRAAYAAALQEKVEGKRINGSDKIHRLNRFDQGDPIVLREAQNLREAKELAAAARAHEAADRAKAHERGGPER